MLGQDTLKTTTEGSMVVFTSARIRLVSKSLVSVSPDGIRGQPVQDLLLVPSASVEPSLHLVEHHSLDLGYEIQLGPSNHMTGSSQFGLLKDGWNKHSRIGSVTL